MNAANAGQRPTAWTNEADLTQEQHAKYGLYVRACENVRRRAAAAQRESEHAAACLKAAKGDTQAALALALSGACR